MDFLYGLTAETARERFAAYAAYLETVRGRMPAAAYEFAAAPWHYDPAASECPHDAWVESLVISEPSSGERREVRGLEIRARLLGAYHDGYIGLEYQGVRGYALTRSSRAGRRPDAGGHGDWLIDEVRVSEDGHVLHEVVFDLGGRWLIKCDDIIFRWERTKEKPSL